MPLELPNLDDRTYNDLVQEALSLIPSYAPEWTDYNPSDPGITLIEMFAYITEMLIYRLNLVTDENKYKFLKLINGSDWQPEKTLNEEIQATILQLRQCDRAVTKEDFETLALKASPDVARVCCLPRRNLELTLADYSPALIEKPGHVSVIIVPRSQESNPQPSVDLIKKVSDELDKRRLLTTKLHVVGPKYLTIGVQITIALNRDIKVEGEKKDDIKKQIITRIQNFFDPLYGGKEGKGWGFGRNVYVSEIYELLDQQPEIDYVLRAKNNNVELDEITVQGNDSSNRQIKVQNRLIAINLRDNELVNCQINNDAIEIITPIKYNV